MNQMTRVLVFDRTDNYICDLDPAKVLGLTSTEEINGEHALTITTLHELAKTNRVLVCDNMHHWHEYVIVGTSEEHGGDAERTTYEYYCVWSLQYDLSATYVNNQYGAGIVPGHASRPVTARVALGVALEGTARWTIGTVGVTTKAAASFYRRSGWDAIKTVLEKWGGEVQATITVSTTGVVERRVDLLKHVGASTATRRFDYGFDISSITRTVSDEVWPCRIIPLGASQETDAGGYTRRPDISSVNGGVAWLQDDDVVPYVRIPDGQGGWEYPTVIVENDTYEVPNDLKNWALEHIGEYTRPQVTYEANVVQLTKAGLDPHGVALGDEIVVVDRTFGSEPLRISARVIKITCDLLDSTNTVLEIGNARQTLVGQFADLTRSVSELAEQLASTNQWQQGEDYVSALIKRINDEANATGGYTYITEGQGTRTYDVAVSDPLVGAEANMVVEVKGGNIRIANTKDSSGNWEWKTVIQSGVINSEIIRAITSGDGWITQMTSHGMEVLEGLVSRSYFGETARIGATDESHVEVDSHALRLIGSDGETYLEVTDVRDSSGRAKVTEILDYPYPPTPTTYTLRHTAYGDPTTWKLVHIPSGYVFTQPGEYYITQEGDRLVFEYDVQTAGPLGPGRLVLTYKTLDTDSDAFTFGSRVASSTAGELSFSEGYQNTASGGMSHAEGYETVASGLASHAQNLGTIAASEAQTAIGRYNRRDASGKYALMIGNGYSDALRGNAFTVDWDGEVRAVGDVHVGGDTLYVRGGLDETRTYLQMIDNTLVSNTTRLGTHRKVNDTDVYNNLNLTIDSSGNRSVAVSDVAPWLDMLGLSVSSTTAAGVSGGTVNIRRSGKVVTIQCTGLKLASALANNTTSPTLATIPSGYRPPWNVYGVLAVAGTNVGGSYVRIDSSGAVTVRNQSGSSMATSLNLATTITYVIS